MSNFENKFKMLTCDQCPAFFTHKHNLAFHVKNKHSISLKITNVQSLINHHLAEPTDVNETSNETNLVKEPEPTDGLEASEAKQLNNGALQCPDCLKFFSTEYLLERHTKLFHDPKRTHKCEHCPKLFPNKHQLSSHIAIHSGDSYACPFCTTKSFPQKNNLDLHIEFHTTPRPFMCAVCSLHFVSNDNLQSHMEVIHGSNLVICCSESFFTKTELEKHEKLFHTGSFQCDICPKAFPNESSLALHKILHSKTKHFCTYCSKNFKRTDEYNTHVQTHLKPLYMCNVCDQSFYRRSYLYNHMKKKHRTKSKSNWMLFQCSLCPKSFKTHRGLKVHVQIHNGSLACVHCSKTFTRRIWYRRHVEKCRNGSRDSDISNSDLPDVPVATLHEDTAFIGPSNSSLTMPSSLTSENPVKAISRHEKHDSKSVRSDHQYHKRYEQHLNPFLNVSVNLSMP